MRRSRRRGVDAPEAMPAVSAAEVLSRQGHARPVFVEALGGPGARARFEQEHLAGARLLALDDDLAAVPPDARDGGRHPLPSPEAFAAALSREGIARDRPVAVLDDRDGGNAAARLYVMLRAVGHPEVLWVAGGRAALKRAGAPMAAGPAEPVVATDYPVTPWSIPLASMADTERALEDGSAVVLDARAGERYRGETEPFDPIPGHVPGARSLPYTELLDPAGAFLPAPVLRERLSAVGAADGPVIVQCGSGVTACMLMIAMEEAGLSRIGPTGPSLWVGSYSEWSRSGKPIARGA